jgi:hypothetical protein
MSRRLRAVYCAGTFLPQEPCDVPEGSEVELIIEGPFIFPPEVKEPEERERVLRATVQRMQQNPIPAEAPPLTREALHERG